MNDWGTRRVTIELLHWGDAWRSHDLLHPRSGYAHVRRMLKEIEDRYARNSTSPAPVVAGGSLPPTAPASMPVEAAAPMPVERAEMVSTASPSTPSSASSSHSAPLTPFYR
jgi:hypothetical protein